VIPPRFGSRCALPLSLSLFANLPEVEFYFSDSNLPFDKFLWGMVTKDNKPVPVKLIASFKRMQRFKDYSIIIAALKDSEKLDVEGDEGEEMVKRKQPLLVTPAPKQVEKKPEIREVVDKALKRSIYAVSCPFLFNPMPAD
jgi:lupus La protein